MHDVAIMADENQPSVIWNVELGNGYPLSIRHHDGRRSLQRKHGSLAPTKVLNGCGVDRHPDSASVLPTFIIVFVRCGRGKIIEAFPLFLAVTLAAWETQSRALRRDDGACG